MKNKKIIVIVLVLIAIIVVAVALFLAYKDINARNQLTKEINELSETNINTDITIEGEYGKIEKLVKEDYKAYFDATNKLRQNYDNVGNIKVLNIENFKNDGPDFNNSLGTLNTIKTENQEIITTLNNLVDEAKIEERAINAGLEGKYKSLYKDILQQIKLNEGVTKIKETDTKFDGYLNSLIDVLNYMKDNKSEWFIENDTLKSKSQTFIDEYNTKVQNTNIEL